MPDASWKQIIPMRRLFTFTQRSFRSSRPVGRVGFKVKELAKGIKNLQGYHNPFLKLPNELLLMIANFLDKEFQVLLSLSCRRLCVLLNSCLDLSLCDKKCKAAILTMPWTWLSWTSNVSLMRFHVQMASYVMAELSLSACGMSPAQGHIKIIRVVHARQSEHLGNTRSCRPHPSSPRAREATRSAFIFLEHQREWLQWCDPNEWGALSGRTTSAC